MRKVLKYILLTIGIIIFLIVALTLIVPQFISVDDYKPKIEQLITEKTGYPLTLGGDVHLSLFPWVGLSFSALKLDNPKGFTQREFISVKNFEARLKFIPLVFKKVEIDTFVIDEPLIVLERNSKGRWNWEKTNRRINRESIPETTTTTGPAETTPRQTQPPPPKRDGRELTLESLVVDEFSIKNGTIRVVDRQTKMTHELSGIDLKPTHISLDQPIRLELRARLDDRPFRLEGAIGPLGSDPGMGRLNLDLTLTALDTASLQASGYLENSSRAPAYQLQLSVAPFNPRRLLQDAKLGSRIKTTDPSVLSSLAFTATLSGDLNQMTLSAGQLSLDESNIDLSVHAKNFASPDLTMALVIDTIDIDRYLPQPREDARPQESAPSAAPPTPRPAGTTTNSSNPVPEPPAVPSSPAHHKTNVASPIDYQPLRKLSLNSSVEIGSLKIHGGTITDLSLKLDGTKGIFDITSLVMKLYEGTLGATGRVNLQQAEPATTLKIDLAGVQVGPLLHDFARKDLLEGKVKAELNLDMKGDRADVITRSLDGGGTFLFKDGALIGIDLARLARTIKSGFMLEEQGERPRTDFAELSAPFSIDNGLVQLSDVSLKSPFIRAETNGSADLVSESLNLRVKPKIVGTIKGQGDLEKRSGIAIPILVGGTFSAPKFSPDLKGLAEEQKIDKEEIKEIIKNRRISPERKEQLKEEVEKAKGLLKDFFGN